MDGTDWTNDEYVVDGTDSIDGKKILGWYSKTYAITKVYSEQRRSVRVTPWLMRGKGRVPSESKMS